MRLPMGLGTPFHRERAYMKIHDDHLYHGAALIQIAEHPTFKAINSLKIGNTESRVAYAINGDIAVYLKYASRPVGGYKEYVFSFSEDQLTELDSIADVKPKTHVVLVCVKDREVCLLSYAELKVLRELREKDRGRAEESLQVMVTAPANKSLRVYVNAAGTKGKNLGERVVSRRNFPEKIFS
jgi:hypothetical protein